MSDIIDNVEQSGDQVENLRGAYRDPFLGMKSEQLDPYRDKLIAVLQRTGEIIAVASTLQALRSMVASSKHQAEPWKLCQGPSSESPLSLDELTLQANSPDEQSEA